MNEWIDRKAALMLLGVKPQTLYAYVSRGRIAVQADPADSRRSLYSAEDVTALKTRRVRGRKPSSIAKSSMAWGEPAILTSISTAHHGKLYYRGQNAVDLARTATLEDVAALLWAVLPDQVSFASPESSLDNPFQALAAMVQNSEPILSRSRHRMAQDAQAVVGRLALSVGLPPSDASLDQRLAIAWNLDEIAAVQARQALILMADHDLNASTFATRVAASTGASMAASVLAGLCALSGPRHGGASAALLSLIQESEYAQPRAAVQRWLDHDAFLPGFGHPLYPSGDPRAVMMLEDINLDGLMLELRDTVADVTGMLPNCDFAMSALVRCGGFPASAPFTLFMLARSVGWCAHAMEQISTGALIRPRGLYEGLPVE